MNKDFDERIVPAGEYRDALNIQISTTDDSDVGSAQTVMGNVLISSGMVPDGSHCVGSIASDKEDKVYYLVAGPRFIPSTMNYINGCWKDYIIEYDVKTEEEIQEIRDNGEDQQEVFEHWLCSDWFINQMKISLKQGKPIIRKRIGRIRL